MQTASDFANNHHDVINTIVGILAFFGVAGVVALFNAYKAVQWKRAEIASSYLKDFYSDPETAFACRCLDWEVGRMVVPSCLKPLLRDGSDIIEHDINVMAFSMTDTISLSDFDRNPVMYVYRTSMDSLLTKLSIIANCLRNKLFRPTDIDDIGYWVVRIHSVEFMESFIRSYGYENSTKYLRKKFSYSYNLFGSTVLNQTNER